MDNPFRIGIHYKSTNYIDDIVIHIFKDYKLILDGTEKTLCGKMKVRDLGESSMPLDTLEEFEESIATGEHLICKSCLKIYKNYIKKLKGEKNEQKSTKTN